MTQQPPSQHSAEPDDTTVLLAERACGRLSERYALFADRGHASSIADLFTPAGVFSTPEMVLTGREEIRETLRRRERLTRLRTVHQLTGILVDVTGPDTATGWVTLALYRRFAADDTTPATDTRPVLLGHYEDTYTRSGGGWLIASRRQHITFRDSTDPGWVEPPSAGRT